MMGKTERVVGRWAWGGRFLGVCERKEMLGLILIS
jgi:hypothetical protein